MRTKERTYEILEGHRRDQATDITNLVICGLIGLNLAMFTLSTVDSVYQSWSGLFNTLEGVSVVVFSAEYAMRLWSCTSDEKYSAPVLGRLRFAARPLLLIDLLAILPSFLPSVGLNLLFLRSLRVNRLFRAAKLARYSKALQSFGRVIAAKKYELWTAVAIICLALFLGSSFEYFAERGAQPDKFSSIPASLWWGVTTMTTVGYGDVVPKTLIGKMVGSFAALLGIAIFALPASILAAGFLEEFQRRRSRSSLVCNRCGNWIGLDR
jgi:voltage-gated potassium channel